MNLENFCQSCSMPLDDPQYRGTEKNGSPSAEYCKYCYSKGAFTNPGLTCEEMVDRLTKLMKQNRLPPGLLEAAISRLPHLERWQKEFTLV